MGFWVFIHGLNKLNKLYKFILKVNKLSNKEDIWKIVNIKRDDYIKFSDQIFDMLVTLYQEFRSVAEHTKMLKKKASRLLKVFAISQLQ